MWRSPRRLRARKAQLFATLVTSFLPVGNECVQGTRSGSQVSTMAKALPETMASSISEDAAAIMRTRAVFGGSPCDAADVFLGQATPFMAVCYLLANVRNKDENALAVVGRMEERGLATPEATVAASATATGLDSLKRAARGRHEPLISLAKWWVEVEDPESTLESAPNVGDKICATFDDKVRKKPGKMIVDTHVHRVAENLGWIPAGTSPKKTALAIEAVIPAEERGALNSAVVGLSQLVRERKCDFLDIPTRADFDVFHRGWPEARLNVLYVTAENAAAILRAGKDVESRKADFKFLDGKWCALLVTKTKPRDYAYGFYKRLVETFDIEADAEERRGAGFVGAARIGPCTQYDSLVPALRSKWAMRGTPHCGEKNQVKGNRIYPVCDCKGWEDDPVKYVPPSPGPAKTLSLNSLPSGVASALWDRAAAKRRSDEEGRSGEGRKRKRRGEEEEEDEDEGGPDRDGLARRVK